MPEISEPDFYERMVARHSGDSIVVTGPDGLTEWANDAFIRMSGYQMEELVGIKPGVLLQGPDTDPETVRAISDALRERRPIRTEILNYDKVRTPYWLEILITPVFDEAGRHTHFMSIERDITERKNLESASNEVLSREKHREAERVLVGQISEWLYSAKSLDELLMVVQRGMETLIPEAEGALYIYASSRDTLDEITTWGDADVPNRVKPDQCWALRRGRAYSFGTRAIEFPCEHVMNEGCPYFCLPILALGETIGLLHISFTSLDLTTERRALVETFIQQRWQLALLCAEQISLAVANVQLRQELIDQSVRDPLTGLWNRRWLLETMHKVQSRARQSGLPYSLISLDVDRFKQFNDHYGHDAGDVVLRETAKVIEETAGPRGHVCRIGGEEFVVLCPDIDHDPACLLADEIRAALATREVTYAGDRLPAITVSSGIATYPEDGATVVDLMRVADLALYAAKGAGRDRVLSCRKIEKPKREKAKAG